MYRVWIGTLSCGEAEHDMCLAAIKAQKNVVITHCMIENLPELEAHNALYNEWNAAKKNHDIFVKVDADTVLINDTIVSRMCDKFFANNLDAMQIYLLDYFTDGFIAGLNAYSPSLEFKTTNNKLYPDRNMTSKYKNPMFGDQLLDLAPAGKHCMYPHKLQAFHYGLHRMLKGQQSNMHKVFTAWNSKGGDGRAYALAGAMLSSKLAKNIDYNDPVLQAYVNSLCLDAETCSKIMTYGSTL